MAVLCSKAIQVIMNPSSDWVYGGGLEINQCGGVSGTPIPGVNPSANHVDISLNGCSQGTTCGEGVPVTDINSNFCVEKVYGPFGTNKTIALTSTYNIARNPAAWPGCGTIDGFSRIGITWIGLSAYTGNIFHQVDHTTGTSQSGAANTSGTLLAGNTATIIIYGAYESINPPTCSLLGDITVT